MKHRFSFDLYNTDEVERLKKALDEAKIDYKESFIRNYTGNIKDRYQRIKTLLRNHASLSTKQVFSKMSTTGVSYKTIQRDLNNLLLLNEVSLKKINDKGVSHLWVIKE